MNGPPGNFDVLNFIYVCVHESEDCVSLEYHFVTAGADIQGSKFKDTYVKTRIL